MKKKYPIVLVVGRTNVGKSTLFNRLTGINKSIVFEREGVTRDYLHEVVEWNGKTFDLIDTGGLQFNNDEGDILSQVKKSVIDLFDKAHCIVFVCDVKNGLVDEDSRIAQLLRRSKKPVIVALNKADNVRAYEENHTDFYRLGFSTFLPLSATHGSGISALLEEVTKDMPQTAELEEGAQYSVAIIGKPNAGKSSLLNLLLGEQRAIVSPIPGTTRESISEKINFFQNAIQITDTAGIRRKSRITDELETLMVKNAFQSARHADIILMMIDASQGRLSDQELKLMFYAFEEKKPMLVLFNKTDILPQMAQEQIKLQIEEYEFFFKKVPILWISCVSEKNVGKILKEVQKLWERKHLEINSTALNALIQDALHDKPLYHKTELIKIFKIRQVKASTPTFVIHANYPEWVGESQKGFIENIMRKQYDFKGIPLTFIAREV